jgi:hypothetical protein
MTPGRSRSLASPRQPNYVWCMMTDEVENLVLKILRNLQADMGKVNLRLDDIVDSMRRIQNDIAVQRGEAGAARHDIDVLASRWRDLEVRVRALEGADPAN